MWKPSAFVLGFAFLASFQGCGNPPTGREVVKIIGGQCNILTGDSCNPLQLPMYSGQGFSPTSLFHATSDQVTYDHVEHRDQEIQVSFSQTIRDVAVHDALRFGLGLGLSGLIKGIFSASGAYRNLVQQMNADSSASYYAEMSDRYTVYTVHLSPESELHLAESFRHAAKELPKQPSNDDDYMKWFSFFESFGTHYVKSVAYGGEMRLSLLFRSDVEKDETVKRSSWEFDLRALFQRIIHVNVSFGIDHTKDEFEAFSQYTFQQQFHATGGEQSSRNRTEWLATVKQNPAPIKTELESIARFFPTSDFQMILKRYFAACPSSERGVCNEMGLCNFKKRTCECDPEDAYQDQDGNCYPKCRDNCSGHGRCVKGTCHCDFNMEYGMGFWSPPGKKPCSEACGQKVYDKGTNAALCCPGKPGCEFMGVQDGAADCFCRKKCPFDDVQGHGETHRFFFAFSTYSCMDDSNLCWGVTCPVYRKITCTHGSRVSCPQSLGEPSTNESEVII